MLGDRAEAKVGYTVRFRLVRDQLRLVHDRFGTTGYWSAVRDIVGAALAVALAQPDVTLDSLYPGQRQELEQQLRRLHQVRELFLEQQFPSDDQLDHL